MTTTKIDDLPPARPKKPTMSPADIADALGITARHAITMLSTGEIPGAFRIGRLWRIKVVDFDSWLASRGVQQ